MPDTATKPAIVAINCKTGQPVKVRDVRDLLVLLRERAYKNPGPEIIPSWPFNSEGLLERNFLVGISIRRWILTLALDRALLILWRTLVLRIVVGPLC